MSVGTINTAKELARGYQPLLLAEFTFTDGTVLRLSTHPLRVSDGGYQYNGHDYLPRIQSYNIDAFQMVSDQGVSIPPSANIVLNDGDKYIWVNYENAHGFRGADLVLRFVFYDVATGSFSDDSTAPFLGVCSAPSTDEGLTTLTIRAVSLMNMTGTMLPTIHIQRTCPWSFPQTKPDRVDGALNKGSWCWECGYSPDVTDTDGPGGTAAARGNLNGSTPYTACANTKEECQARGMYSTDGASRATGRFGGVQWEPPQMFRSRGYISGNWEEGFNTTNEAKYGDFLPVPYGTIWIDPIVLPLTGEANSTRFEAVICYGEIQAVLKVVVNDVEVPAATDIDGNPYTVSDPLFRYNVVTRGSRNGKACVDAGFASAGDPHGSMAVIEVVVPRSLADSASVPRVLVLIQGPKIRRYQAITSITVTSGVATVTLVGANTSIASNDADYAYVIAGNTLSAINGLHHGLTMWTAGPPGTVTFNAPGVPDGTGTGGSIGFDAYADEPTWALVDMLSWAGWDYADLNPESFMQAASVCDVPVSYRDLSGATTSHARFRFAAVLRQRRSAAEVVRGTLTAMRGTLVPGMDGRLGLVVRQTLADQQPAPMPGSNYNTPVASMHADGTAVNGYVAYRFDYSNITKGDDGKPHITVSQKANTDCTSGVSFSFQDEDNQNAQDSLTITDTDALMRSGQQVAGNIPVDGIPNYDQGRRVSATWLAEQYRGNMRNSDQGGDAGGTLVFDFETTHRVVHLRVADLCLIDLPVLGVSNQLVRVVKIQPTTNFETARVALQWHNDLWYLDAWGQGASPLFSGIGKRRVSRPPYPILIGRYNDVVYTPDPLWPDERPAYNLTSAFHSTAQLANQYTFRAACVLPVNSFGAMRAPMTPLQADVATTGGHLPGGRTYWIALVAVASDGTRSAASVPASVYVPTGTSTNEITLSDLDWDSATAGYDVFVTDNPSRWYCYGYHAGTPSSVTFGGGNETSLGPLISSEAKRPIPDTEFSTLRLKLKRLLVPGVWSGQVTGISGQNITATGTGWTVNAFAGRVVSFVGRNWAASPIEQVPESGNFLIVSNTADTLTVDAAYGPVPSTIGNPVAGDALYSVVRCKATTYSATTIGDSALALTPNDSVGRMVRIISGTGAGQVRHVSTNTATVLTVDAIWSTFPDSTSIFWIEDGTWAKIQDIDTGAITEAAPVYWSEHIIDVAGLEHQSMVISPVAVDDAGYESFESASAAAVRDFYLFKDTTRTNAGAYQAQATITVDGTLAIGSDQGPRLSFAADQTAKGVRLDVKQAPTGAGLTVALLVGVTPWLTLTIPDGSTSVEATTLQIDALAAIGAGANVRVDVTAVGTTYPGSDLTVSIYI